MVRIPFFVSPGIVKLPPARWWEVRIPSFVPAGHVRTYLLGRRKGCGFIPLAPGWVNHHNQSIVFGVGIVYIEGKPTYTWLLEQLLEAMDGKSPISVIIDGDLAMKNIITAVFPKSHHKLCAWHLLRNATSARTCIQSSRSMLPRGSPCLNLFITFIIVLSIYVLENTKLTLSPSKECLLCKQFRQATFEPLEKSAAELLVHENGISRHTMEVSARSIENGARFVIARDWVIEILKAWDAEDAGRDATTATNTTSNVHGSTSCAPRDPPVCKTKGRSLVIKVVGFYNTAPFVKA
ncbi:hypothetical protein AHAS_Ahas11G0224600 [Arachis hypogaea]